jgi:energy-coupling factor transporter ATP-binding protein EcfA2
MPSSQLPDDPSFITREVYDETRYTPEARRIIDEEFKRRAEIVQMAKDIQVSVDRILAMSDEELLGEDEDDA